MPYVLITHSHSADRATNLALAQGLTALMQEVLGKKAALTSVRVEVVTEPVWTIAGAVPPISAHVEANITAGTNTAAEKAEFIRRAMALLHQLLGALPEATYVIIREVPATDWGYDGRTQGDRKAEGARAGRQDLPQPQAR